ncbi:MAG: GNAT family N-acetyltransferase [Anaerolineae bacterium]|nr:GNAT family N-acetyltransferase [Anaerolineae bacterium]
MHIRPAESRDLEACAALDHSYTTDRVWQMEAREGEGNSILMVTFREARLPREVRVEYPLRGEELRRSWQQCDALLVAEEGRRICGYVAVTAQAGPCIAWVNELVVDRPLRRQGIGTRLLEAASWWGFSQGMRRLLIEVQTKNYPAIRFCKSRGLTLCGYVDHYWPAQDIALFFGMSLR